MHCTASDLDFLQKRHVAGRCGLSREQFSSEGVRYTSHWSAWWRSRQLFEHENIPQPKHESMKNESGMNSLGLTPLSSKRLPQHLHSMGGSDGVVFSGVGWDAELPGAWV